ncbi:MAG: DUF4336 domain-containing protein [Myxococcota bacterium]
MRLKRIAQDLWTVEHEHFAFGIHFPGRMTVVRLPDGHLWLCSPVPIDASLAAELAELGPVRWLVAPNRFHHIHLEAVIQRYPDAQLLGAPGLPEKRKDLSFDATLDGALPTSWAGVFEAQVLDGAPALNEVVFFHRPSGTLVTTDLFMNVHETKGALSKFVYWAEGCWRRPRVPRLFSLITKDKARMKAAAEELVKWPIGRVILAHGAIVEDHAEAVVAEEMKRAFGVEPLPQGAAHVA